MLEMETHKEHHKKQKEERKAKVSHTRFIC